MQRREQKITTNKTNKNSQKEKHKEVEPMKYIRWYT